MYSLKTKSMFQRLGCATVFGLLLAAGTNQALARTTLGTYAPGQPIDGLVGVDGLTDATISLDELGKGTADFHGFFGPYDVTVTHIPSTVNPAWAGLEVTSYLVKGKGGLAQIELAPGVVGISEPGVQGFSDALVFTSINPLYDPLNPAFSGRGSVFGTTRIDFLSDGENPLNIIADRIVIENNLGIATYLASGSYGNGNNNEQVTYTIDSSAPDRVPDSGATASLLGLAMLGLAVVRRKLNLV